MKTNFLNFLTLLLILALVSGCTKQTNDGPVYADENASDGGARCLEW